MRGQLANYLRRRVGFQILALLIALTAMMQVFELLDVTTDVLQRDQGVRGLLYYAALRTPSELVLSLPLAVLLGTMTSLHALARAHEITAMRAAGLNAMRMLAFLGPIIVVLGVAQFALTERVLPRTENNLKKWWNASAPTDQAPTRLWAHTPEGVASIDRISPDGRELQGLRIYRRDDQSLLTARISAVHATWTDGSWQMKDVTQLLIENGQLKRTHEDSREWQTNLRPSDVLRLDVVRPRLSSRMLADVIAGNRVGTQPLNYYRTALYRSFTAPFTPFIMLLLALPIAYGMLRGTGGGREMLIVLVLGLAFLLGDGILASIGATGKIAPLATAWIAPITFIAIGLWRLSRCERL